MKRSLLTAAQAAGICDDGRSDDKGVEPEGLQAFTWNGTAYLAIANETSNTTTLYAMAPVPEPQTHALLLAGLGLAGAVARRRRDRR